MGCIQGKEKPSNESQSGGQDQVGVGVNSIQLSVLSHAPTPPHPAPPPLPKRPKSSNTYRAEYSYSGINADDLSFKKGDRLVVDITSQSDDWWIATNQRTGKKGYIPSNYVCKDDDSPQSQAWWFDIDRKKVERKLLTPDTKLGTFLVRESSDKICYVLSVRDIDSVKHYRIKFMDSGAVYIHTKKQFPEIQKLLDHYTRDADGLCTKLTRHCPRVAPIPQFKDLETERQNVKTTKLLGKGHFGEVWEGKLFKTFGVAVKQLKPGTMTQTAFLEEAEHLHKLRHPHLVELVAVCTEEEPILIVMELMDQGALLDYLRKDEGRTVTFNTIVDMAAQIANGMAFLESKNYVHRDLRAANVLVNKSLTVKIADLGLAREIDTDEEEAIYTANETTLFPIKWTAPEALKYRYFSSKSDVWSFGVLMYELITFGRIPYPGQSGREVMQDLEKGKIMPKPEGPINYDPAYYDAMVKCWEKEPSNRPTFEYLHQMLDDFNVSTENQYPDPEP